MEDFLPEALVTGEAPAYAFRPRTSAKRVRSSPISEDPGGELDAEPGEARQDFGVRMLRERLLHCLSELIGGCAGGLQLNEEGEHLLAERVLDERWLVGPLGSENVAEPLGLRLDATLAAGALERGLDLGASITPVSSTRATSCVLSAQSIPQ